MPATPLTNTRVSHTALIALPTAPSADPTNGNSIPNGGSTIVLVENTDTASHTLTVEFARSFDGQVVTPKVHTLVASTKYMLRMGPVSDYGNVVKVTANSNLVKITPFELA